MQANSWRSCNPLLKVKGPFFCVAFSALVCMGLDAFGSSSLGGSGFFAGNDIDYWREGKKVQPFLPSSALQAATHREVPLAGSLIRQRDAQPFDWKNYEDPSNPEFWDDGGDYVAPRPLREAVANPTPGNLEKYAAWQAKRLVVLAEFNRKLAAYTLAQAAANGTDALSPRTPEETLSDVPKVNLREVSLLYFYQTSCPHCQGERAQVEDLRRRGVQVTFVQLDAGENEPLHNPSVPYSPNLAHEFSITGTPTWVFRRRDKVFRLQGEQSQQDLMSVIANLFQPEPSKQVGAWNDQGVTP